MGCRVIEDLVRRGLPEGVKALDGGAGGLELLDLVDGWKRVVIVDAAEIGKEAGEFVRFTPSDARLASRADSFSGHGVGLSEVLALAEALGRELPEIVFFGVQPAEMGWQVGLSPAVESTLPAVLAAVVEEVSASEE